MQVLAITIALFATQPSQAEAGEGRAAASAPQPWTEAAATAEQHFREGHHKQAAVTFESLWTEYRRPQHLFNAGIARFASRHLAHAIDRLETYLKLPNTKGSLRATARQQVEQAARECGVVTLGVTSSEATGAVKVELEFLGAGGEARPKLVTVAVIGRPGELAQVQQQLHLDPGVWRVSTTLEGYEPERTTVEVTKQGQARSVLLELRKLPSKLQKPPELPALPEDQPRRRLGFGLVGVGTAAAVSGAVVWGVGAKKLKADYSAAGTQCLNCDEVTSSGNLRANGALVFGVGFGVASIGSIAFVKKTRTRKLAWFSTTVVGAGLVVGGWVANGLGAYDKTETMDEFKTSINQQTAGALVLGLGIGAVTSSVLGLVDTYRQGRRPAKTAKHSLQIQPTVFGQAGAVLSGRF